jgi:hypothetical protein
MHFSNVALVEDLFDERLRGNGLTLKGMSVNLSAILFVETCDDEDDDEILTMPPVDGGDNLDEDDPTKLG